MDTTTSDHDTGAAQFRVSLRLALAGWAAMTLQELALFLRPGPYGTPYVLAVERYLPAAVVWDGWVILLVTGPVLLWWLAHWDAAVAQRPARWVQRAVLALLLFATAVDHIDNELMRFMGLHLSASVVMTYHHVLSWTRDMFVLLLRDQGGPLLPFAVLLLVAALLAWQGRRLIARDPGWPALRRRREGLAAMLGITAIPLLGLLIWPSGNRRQRIEPVVVSLIRRPSMLAGLGTIPTDYPALVRAYQSDWLAESADPGWRFVDSLHPLVRAPLGPPAPAGGVRWNVIYLQLETFRGWDVGFHRPDREFSPTPFLDQLAAQPTSASWIRHLSFGPETVNGLFAGHCSVKPHTRRSPTAMFTATAFRCFPEVLRRHGWHAEFATGVDPDWDFQTYWLRRWYDVVSYSRRKEDSDRLVFRRAAERLRVLASRGTPFLMTIASYSNHLPFRSREPALDLVRSNRPDSAIWNTMHYTDDVIREFVTSIQDEAWFANTLLVITGDHGENFGEHDGTAAQRNGWRETVWTPLIIAGRHPRLPHGTHTDVAGILDIAPTIADLLGIRDTVPWMGHSLVDPVPSARTVTGKRNGARFAERGSWSVVVDPESGALHLYDAMSDPLQRQDFASRWPDTAPPLARRVETEQTLVDYLLESNHIWPLAAPR